MSTLDGVLTFLGGAPTLTLVKVGHIRRHWSSDAARITLSTVRSFGIFSAIREAR